MEERKEPTLLQEREQFMRERIIETLQKTNCNIRLAAKELGIDRRAIYRRLYDWGWLSPGSTSREHLRGHVNAQQAAKEITP